MKLLKTTALLSMPALLLMASCAPKHSITGKFAGLGDNDTVIIQTGPLNAEADPVTDTVVSAKGKFHYDLTDTVNTQVQIYFKKQDRIRVTGRPYQSMARTATLILKPGEHVALTGSIENPYYLDYTVKGKGFSADYAALRPAYKAAELNADSIEMKLDYYMFSKDADALPKAERDSIVNALFAERGKFFNERRQVWSSYLQNNPGTDLAVFCIIQLPLDSLGKYYDLLTSQAKSGLLSQQLDNSKKRYDEYMAVQKAKERIVPGAPAPQFTLKDLKGNDVSLASITGKYVVLDFWGSWCGWCIHGFPEMKKYYEKYKNKVEFIGIDCGDTDEAWRKAVETHKLPWLQLFNDPQNNVPVMYAVEGYPTKLILDKEHKIVAVIVGESPEFYKKLDELLK